MKILKPGKVEQRKFVCPSCGCVFVATEQEKYLAHDDCYQAWMEVQCPCYVAIKWEDGEAYEEPVQDDREKVTESDSLDDVRKAVESAPEVKSSGWIDIRDQKPEVGSEIIGLYAYGGIAAFVVEIDGYRKDCTAEYCKVDYWLPMPELPEEYR